ncbi:MAG: glutamate--tRNA ligase [Gallionellales bacterium 35-53-114]|jgi:glutamyl-tRNA synthetase|nr:MAG: glutamate--tRNA ligase [Gallionellales bacterium 35-53-114]OYZ62998.1 MAG: glutamate--tRNA ligase [Gallionellales bacterium 24-53-125]OZB09021.1 MAG: glutamate--tRNA ligase [Gallionellales bacterium 39-52-133]HQS59297.1 glutamate--tRNA ligase [Gallionellaceae bacterium]HQS76210.1 glutamate--tRNA ligase [Gallionellaceae bacterium]
MTVRTRFAPSPTGYLHIGGARTALFSWAYARKHGGTFILRIEDTDVERSTPEAVQAILDGMNWLSLGYDEGPFYQMQGMPRYREVIQQMLAAGTAYYCYTSAAELDALREAQRERNEKPRYDGRWRPEAGKTLPEVPAGVKPVVRFKNPVEGVAAWKDLVKGDIEFANSELDDLVIARADGTPTYNFCVVVDDWDMKITHVIRGDDHVNNTPRQINILRALGASVPQYAHLSMILGDDGQKLSKRHGAVSVMQYDEDGYLPEAVINYLARLGWSHGDEEVFSVAQFCEWFDLDHITPSAAQFNTEKLNWLNSHYLKQADNARLVALVKPRLEARGVKVGATPSLEAIVALYKERVATLNELADAAEVFYIDLHPEQALLDTHLTADALPALHELAQRFSSVVWEAPAIAALIKELIAKHGLKMPKMAMPLRVMLTGQTQTPSVDALLAIFPRELVLSRLDRHLSKNQ